MCQENYLTLLAKNVGTLSNASTRSKTGRVPLSSQISEMLIRDIQSGELPDGERLPPEREMAQQLNISVGTLRKSLSELEERNLLRRVQGSGNYIHNTLNIDNVYALFRLERVSGPAVPSATLLSVKRMAKPAYVPFIGGSTKAFRFRRQRQLGDVDAALEEIWLDGRYAQSIAPEDISDSMYRFYQDQLGVRIIRIEDRVGVAPLPRWAPATLNRINCSHWGFIERVSRDQDGQLAEYSRTWFDPSHVRFVAR